MAKPGVWRRRMKRCCRCFVFFLQRTLAYVTLEHTDRRTRDTFYDIGGLHDGYDFEIFCESCLYDSIKLQSIRKFRVIIMPFSCQCVLVSFIKSTKKLFLYSTLEYLIY